MNFEKPIKILFTGADCHRTDNMKNLISGMSDFIIYSNNPERDDFFSTLVQVKPHLVLADISTSDNHGEHLIKSIKNTHPAISILAINSEFAPSILKKTINAGATGYILKEKLSDAILGIKTILDGSIFISV
ncbi:MAG: response regulator [Spirochaetes bacterium]|jgi:DNA-binding NarL/FixJ family response regulator|nr:response regulator [Spirochaetota bacterium]